MPIEVEEEIGTEQTDTGRILSQKAEQYAPHNRYVAELTPEVVNEKLRNGMGVIAAVSKIEQMEQPQDEEARATRQAILNAAKLFYQDNFISTAQRSYEKVENTTGNSETNEITIEIDQDKRRKEMAEMDALIDSEDFQKKLAHARQVRENIKSREKDTASTERTYTEMSISSEEREAILQDTYGILTKLETAQTLLNRSELDQATTEAYQLVIAAAYNGATGTKLRDPDMQEELKVVIDEEKRQKSVDELTSTDFFTNLKSRAKEMRQRHHTTTTTTPVYGTETRTDTLR